MYASLQNLFVSACIWTAFVLRKLSFFKISIDVFVVVVVDFLVRSRFSANILRLFRFVFCFLQIKNRAEIRQFVQKHAKCVGARKKRERKK